MREVELSPITGKRIQVVTSLCDPHPTVWLSVSMESNICLRGGDVQDLGKPHLCLKSLFCSPSHMHTKPGDG